MRPVRDLKNLVLRCQAMPGSGAFRAACRTPIVPGFDRIYHYHIRKTAGTSINQAFLSIGGESGEAVYHRLVSDRHHRTLSGSRAFVGWSWGLIEQGRYHYAFSHYAAHEVRLPPRTFTLTCLRDPVNRLISYYSMLCAMRDEGSSHGALKLAGPWLGSSLKDFLHNAPRSFLSMQLYMFSKAFHVQEAIDGVMACHAVLFTEEFASGLGALARRLNMTLPVLHARPTQKKPAISEDERAAAREALAPEYEMFSAVRASHGS